MSGWAAFGGESQVVTTEQDGSDLRVLAQEGEVQELGWGSVLPGGDAVMNCSLIVPGGRHRTPAVNPGRLVRVFRGDVVWRGTMAEPDPAAGGWNITAAGEGTYGNNFRAVDGGGVTGSSNPASCDAMIRGAIARGLPWRTALYNYDGVQGMDLTQLYEKGSRSVTESLNAFTDGGTLTWTVGGQGGRPPVLRIFPMPGVTQSYGQAQRLPPPPTRLLISADPVGRSLNGYYDVMYVRYQSSQDDPNGGAAASYDLAQAAFPSQIARHGRLEGYGDYSNAGYMTLNDAGSRALGVLTAYQATSFTQSYSVTPGQVLTLDGCPVDLGLERAGEVYKVIYADLGAGGEVTTADQIVFLSGQYDWNDVEQAGKIQPYQYIAQDFTSLVTAMAPPAVMPANVGG